MFYVIAHNIRSLHNVGSIFRTADAFGVDKLYLTGHTGHPGLGEKHIRQIFKTALGAEKYVPWEYAFSAVKLIKSLKSSGVQVIGLENHISGSIPLQKFKPRFPLALVLGEETKGIPRPIVKLCDRLIEIPMSGKKESLNVSVAFGIAAYAIKN